MELVLLVLLLIKLVATLKNTTELPGLKPLLMVLFFLMLPLLLPELLLLPPYTLLSFPTIMVQLTQPPPESVVPVKLPLFGELTRRT